MSGIWNSPLWCVLVAIVLNSFAALAQTQTAKPNIVFILVDNVGWGDFSVYGGTTATPRIDKLASEGIRFNNYNAEGQCTPSRSAIMTGRHPIRSGTWSVVPVPPPGKFGLAPWEYTIAELHRLKRAGPTSHRGQCLNKCSTVVEFGCVSLPKETGNRSRPTSLGRLFRDEIIFHYLVGLRLHSSLLQHGNYSEYICTVRRPIGSILHTPDANVISPDCCHMRRTLTRASPIFRSLSVG